MPGLIGSELPNTSTQNVLGNDIATANTTTYDPERRAVDQARETVSGQLDALLAREGPYLERARAGATQTANRRGLINSSIAAGAGEAAAIDAALPIATADANIYGTASRDNQVAGNAALSQGAAASNTTALANADSQNRITGANFAAELEEGLIGTRAEAETGLIETRGEVDRALQEMRGEQATTLATIEANYRQLMQANASAASVFNESMQQMATILRDPNTSAAQKESAVTALMDLLESSLAVQGAIGNLNLVDLLDFGEEAP